MSSSSSFVSAFPRSKPTGADSSGYRRSSRANTAASVRTRPKTSGYAEASKAEVVEGTGRTGVQPPGVVGGPQTTRRRSRRPRANHPTRDHPGFPSEVIELNIQALEAEEPGIVRWLARERRTEMRNSTPPARGVGGGASSTTGPPDEGPSVVARAEPIIVPTGVAPPVPPEVPMPEDDPDPVDTTPPPPVDPPKAPTTPVEDVGPASPMECYCDVVNRHWQTVTTQGRIYLFCRLIFLYMLLPYLAGCFLMIALNFFFDRDWFTVVRLALQRADLWRLSLFIIWATTQLTSICGNLAVPILWFFDLSPQSPCHYVNNVQGGRAIWISGLFLLAFPQLCILLLGGWHVTHWTGIVQLVVYYFFPAAPRAGKVCSLCLESRILALSPVYDPVVVSWALHWLAHRDITPKVYREFLTNARAFMTRLKWPERDVNHRSMAMVAVWDIALEANWIGISRISFYDGMASTVRDWLTTGSWPHERPSQLPPD